MIDRKRSVCHLDSYCVISVSSCGHPVLDVIFIFIRINDKDTCLELIEPVIDKPLRNICRISSRVLVEANIVAILVVNDNCVLLLVWNEHCHLAFFICLIGSSLLVDCHNNRNTLPSCAYVLNILGSSDDYLLHAVLVIRQIFHIDIAATQHGSITLRSDRLSIAIFGEHNLIVVTSGNSECNFTLCVGSISLWCFAVVEEYINLYTSYLDRVDRRSDSDVHLLVGIDNIY